MNYFKYIFSDKKANPYWILFYAFIVIPYLIGFIIDFGEDGQINEFRPIDFLYMLFYLTSFFLFYTFGYFNIRKQEKFFKKYLPFFNYDTDFNREIEVYRNSYTVTGIKTNFRGRINPKPKKDNFKVCKLNNLIVLMGKTYDFGVLRRDTCPIIIDIQNYDNTQEFKFAKNPKIETANWTGNDLEIIFKRSVFGIKKVKLFNWK